MTQQKHITPTSERPFAVWLTEAIESKRVRRGRRDWSLRRIAAEAGISDMYLRQLLAATRLACSDAVATRLAKVLEASTREARSRLALQRLRVMDGKRADLLSRVPRADRIAS